VVAGRLPKNISCLCLIWLFAQNKVMSENKPNSAGVVRRIAISDHCLCVSNPRCLRTSWKVTSSCQRITNQQRIFCGSAPRSVHTQKSLGFELFLRIADQHPAHRHGEQARGVPHTAVSEETSTMRSPLPYQLANVVSCQTVSGSSATTERLGRRSPLRRGLPI